MRILFHSAAPWVKTGYGQQTALFAKRLQDLGHEVAISAYYGITHTTVEWEGLPVFPAASKPEMYGMDMVEHFYHKWNADLVIILADAWVGRSAVESLIGLNVANWIPIDSQPLSSRDELVLRLSKSIPIAMSRFGEKMLRSAGFDPLYVPHAVDTSVFRPCEDLDSRNVLRAELGLDSDTFVVGMNAANRDGWRKGFFETFEGFARFQAKHPNSRLYVHSLIDHPYGNDLAAMARGCGISDSVMFPDQGAYLAGEITSEALVSNFYYIIDMLSSCSWAEGFGIPIIEAQACNLPVAVTAGSAMTEIHGPGCVVVPSEPKWIEGHQACWYAPRVDGVAQAYGRIYERRNIDLSVERRDAIMSYDVNYVVQEYWKPALEALEERIHHGKD
jgi:glycosyltransferase involved in cell wall biosynthesis